MIQKLASEIIEELKKIQGVPIHLLTEDDDFPLPRFIGVGGDRALYINKKIDDLIQRVALYIHEHVGDFRHETSFKDLQPIVRSAFGTALARIDLEDSLENNSVTVVRNTLAFVDDDWSHRTGPQEHCFACTLFGFDAAPFEIGAVRFETRNDWLERHVERKEISKVTARRITGIWQGKRFHKRKPSVDSMCETNVLNLVGECGYVVSITTNGFTQGFAREKAIIAARISLTAIALLWHIPSKRLAGFNLAFDREMRSKVSMTIDRGHLLTSYTKENITGDGAFRDKDWISNHKSAGYHFNLFSEIIDSILKKELDSDRYITLRKIFHATLWFHEGCRETSPLIATVKYAASMDALASGGGKAETILTLFESVLGWKRDSRIFSDSTLESAVSRIYKQGRSRTIHGNNDQVGSDWSNTSARAEQLARYLLLGCIEWAAEEDTKSDISILVKRRNTNRKPEVSS